MEDTEKHSNEKIAEALKLLEAAAREKRDQFKTLVNDRYDHLKEVLLEGESNVKQQFDAVRNRTAESATHFREVGEEKVREVAAQLDESVHDNPWPYIGGVAFVSLMMGYILGRK
jgi:ElaB/YqjD/DUF883 family membrane-anchored ribosome-binding protein